jgi:hypothetical protein
LHFAKKFFFLLLLEDDIERFLQHLTKFREEWQVNQAKEAIELLPGHDTTKGICFVKRNCSGSWLRGSRLIPI